MKFSTIVSGSNGNCIYIEAGSTCLLVDGGCSKKALLAALDSFGRRPEELQALLITHEHHDHISGALRLSRCFGIPIYATELTWENLPFRDEYPQWEENIFEYGMRVGEIGLDFFRLSHDAAQPVGFLLDHEGRRLGIATDTGLVTPSMARLLTNCDALIIEANHDVGMLARGPYSYALKQRVSSERGHLSNLQAGLALRELVGERTRAVVLAHLSATNNSPELALSQVRAALSASPEADHIQLSVAPRCAPHGLISV